MFRKLICTAVLVALSGCGGGSGTSPRNYHSSGITGVVQKGPLIYGSYVNAYLLDEKLNPTGQSYVTQTTDDLGNFKISSNISSSLIRLVASGYYFDEVSGALSTAPTTLSAIVDLTVNKTPTINVLTTLQAPRVEVLIGEGKTYSEALQQSATEVLSVFGIDAAKITGYKSLYGMQINGNQDADSVLLATSSILAKMSSTSAQSSGSSQAAELSYFLSRIASDVAKHGALRSTSIQTSIDSAKSSLNLEGIRSNVEGYYANRGTTLTAPKFEEWIDGNLSGVIPRRMVTATSGAFQTSALSETPNSTVTSNEIEISSEFKSDIFAKTDASVILNGQTVRTGFFTVKNGDKLKLQASSPTWGATTTYKLNLGSQTLDFAVSTGTLETSLARTLETSSTSAATLAAAANAHQDSALAVVSSLVPSSNSTLTAAYNAATVAVAASKASASEAAARALDVTAATKISVLGVVNLGRTICAAAASCTKAELANISYKAAYTSKVAAENALYANKLLSDLRAALLAVNIAIPAVFDVQLAAANTAALAAQTAANDAIKSYGETLTALGITGTLISASTGTTGTPAVTTGTGL